LTVVTLIALRLSLGTHFLYEGWWKIKHSNEFSAAPFLTQAKGPVSGLFYAMVPDINGRQRLQIVVENDKPRINSDPIAATWNDYRQALVNYIKPSDPTDQAAVVAHQRFETDAEKTYKDFKKSLDAYFADNVDDIQAYFGALDRFEKNPEAAQDAPFQKKRNWDQMMDLRREANQWINEIEAREETFKNTLYALMDEQQKGKTASMPCNWKIWQWERMQQINFAVTYGLTAIGICLILGFFTRLAALGGAAFMLFVVMTQPAWPAIYPPDPAVVGHALIINKDFIEMVALLVISTTAVGSWGGLDFFIHRCFIQPFCKKN
jgi:uncharacterized membrane protein YphA (DoxX/SURF4 family)